MGDYFRGRDSLYPHKKGNFDEDIWDKSMLYFYEALHFIRHAIKNNDRDMFERVLQGYNLQNGRFNKNHFIDFSRKEGFKIFSIAKNSDNARFAVKAVQLHEDLVQGLFTLVIPATQSRAALAANRIYLINEKNRRSSTLRDGERVARARCTDPNEHLYEL